MWIILTMSLQNWVFTLNDQILIECRLCSLLIIQELIRICLRHDQTYNSSCPWLGIPLHTILLWEKYWFVDTFKFTTYGTRVIKHRFWIQTRGNHIDTNWYHSCSMDKASSWWSVRILVLVLYLVWIHTCIRMTLHLLSNLLWSWRDPAH